MMTTETTRETTKAVHPFERAGLGKAPFRCTGMTVEKYQACHGAPIQCGASCDFCGTGIMNTFWILSSDGRRFKVGCDCVGKTSDRKLVAEVKAEQSKAERASKATKRADERAARQAAFEAQRAARLAEIAALVTDHAPMLSRLDAMAQGSNEYRARTAAGLAARIREGFAASARMTAFVEKLWAEHNTVKGYVGTVGTAIQIEATIARVVYVGEYEVNSFRSVSQWRWHFGDAQGNEIVWKTSSCPYSVLGIAADRRIEAGERYTAIPEGFAVTLRGKVKAHDSYQGEAQTLVERCKVTAR